MDEIGGEQHARSFGDHLYRLREARGLSQNAAAKRLNISQPRLRDYELGRDPHSARPTYPPRTVVQAMARLYGEPDDVLLLLAGLVPRPVDREDAMVIAGLLTLTPAQRATLAGQAMAAEPAGTYETADGNPS